MQLASVSLPTIRLSSAEQRLDLSLKGSLQLRLPDNMNPPETSNNLLKLVTEKHLWVARTGSCFFQLAVSIQGEGVSGRDQIARLTEWVQNCEVWSRAGLRLQSRERGAAESPGHMSFSIQHPDLSSALVTPKDALRAEFQSVICSVCYSPRQDVPPAAKRSLKRKRGKQSDEGIETQQPGNSCPDDGHVACLAPEDLRAIEAFIESLNMPSYHERRSPTPTLSWGGQAQATIEFSERFRQLLDIAIEIFVLGLGNRYKGVTTIECNRAECLTRLAPAVFNMPYLKSVSDRASLLPVIAASLARMKNAESPSLRQKAVSFAARTTNENHDSGDRVVRGIEKNVWETLLSAIKTPARPNRDRKTKKVISNTESHSRAALNEPNIPPATIEMEERDDAYSMATMTDEQSQTRNHEAMQSHLGQHSPQGIASQQCRLSEIEPSNPAFIPRHVESGTDHAFNFPEMNSQPLMNGPEFSFATDYNAMDSTILGHGPLLLDLGSATTFDEWLCLRETTTENGGLSCETTMTYQTYGDTDVSFYKSYE